MVIFPNLFVGRKKVMDIYFPSVKNYHRNIKYMPAAIFFVRLDLEKNSSFPDRHYLDNERQTSLQAWPGPRRRMKAGRVVKIIT
jgi:hypothetical protein